MEKVLIIRADSSPQIGGGHIMRTFALAQEWIQRGYNVIYLYSLMLKNLKNRLINYSNKIKLIDINVQKGSMLDAQTTINEVKKIKAHCKAIILDGYTFKEDYQIFIKNSVDCPVIYFDDVGISKCYYTDIVFNQNINAKEDMYSCIEPYTELLLGTKYVLLRDEFLKYMDFQRDVSKKPEKLLILLGATDPENYTAEIINILNKYNIPLQLTVISGQAPSEKLNKTLQNYKYNYELKCNVEDMPSEMLKADIAITAGGSTVWELSFMQVPFIGVAKNLYEEKVLEEVHNKKLGLYAGLIKNLNEENFIELINSLIQNESIRKKIVRNQRKYVDGKGRKRFVDKILTLCNENKN